jgi:hypothetical protein
MTVLVDTSVWSLSLRRDEKNLNATEIEIRQELGELIHEGRARIIGPIRQELLSGIRDQAKFKHVLNRMRALDDEALETIDYEEAARINNALRSKGISATPIDCLICAIALRMALSVFTTDKDFRHYADVLPLALHAVT